MTGLRQHGHAMVDTYLHATPGRSAYVTTPLMGVGAILGETG